MLMRYVLLVWGASPEPCCAAFALCQVEMDTPEVLGREGPAAQLVTGTKCILVGAHDTV